MSAGGARRAGGAVCRASGGRGRRCRARPERGARIAAQAVGGVPRGGAGPVRRANGASYRSSGTTGCGDAALDITARGARAAAPSDGGARGLADPGGRAGPTGQLGGRPPRPRPRPTAVGRRLPAASRLRPHGPLYVQVLTAAGQLRAGADAGAGADTARAGLAARGPPSPRSDAEAQIAALVVADARGRWVGAACANHRRDACTFDCALSRASWATSVLRLVVGCDRSGSMVSAILLRHAARPAWRWTHASSASMGLVSRRLRA